MIVNEPTRENKLTRKLIWGGACKYFETPPCTAATHDDVIKWKHFPRYWPFVRGIHRSPVNSPHKGQWRGALIFSLICVLINDWINNREAGHLRRQRTHYDVSVMSVHNLSADGKCYCTHIGLMWTGLSLHVDYHMNMMTSSNWNIFRVTGHLCGEFTGHRWIPRTKTSDAELWCFLWSASE